MKRVKIIRYIMQDLTLMGFLLWFTYCLPDPLMAGGTSTVILDEKNELLGARIAPDGQWRFAPSDTVPERFKTCILQFEDREFYHHPGINPKSVLRAVVQNIKHHRVVSGGSTITMQVARIARKNPKRTLWEKGIEALYAIRMELAFSKEQILSYYVSNAPFGNNVVGLNAASWRYYGRPAQELSWSECATLAVLPNAPGLIYPGKNHQRLLAKRNRLLKQLLLKQEIDTLTYELSLAESLPEKPLILPLNSSHLLNRMVNWGYNGKMVSTTVNDILQSRVVELVQQHSLLLRENKINNAAALVVRIQDGQVLAYAGNTKSSDPGLGCAVDCIIAPRSSGSILKPLLYARSLDEGVITPEMLMPDIPSQFGSFSPRNFSQQYDGAVPLNKALARSLNIPMVRLLNSYGLAKFHRDLNKMGFKTINKPAAHYGLSLILGGAETRLWDLAKVYTGMARQLKGLPNVGLTLAKCHKVENTGAVLLSKGSIYATFEAMVEVNRPDEEGNWRVFSSSRKIAWKTGTSFGFRDAWAVGVTPDYLVAVWVGNANGEGRPGLTGIKSAAPLMFDIFNLLPKSGSWFRPPTEEMKQVSICATSGHRSTNFCEQSELKWVPVKCLQTQGCPYHQLVHLNKSGTERVNTDCEDPGTMQHKNWFVLPPFIEKYYKMNHPAYKLLPPVKQGCGNASDLPLAILYPRPQVGVYVPVQLNGTKGKLIAEAAHRNSLATLYWHLDDVFIGETREIHQLPLLPSAGKHVLTIVDEQGNTATVPFTVREEEDN